MRQLKDVSEAAAILTEKLGRGYSKATIRKAIKNGHWTENKEYINDSHPNSTRRRPKVDVAYVLSRRGVKNG